METITGQITDKRIVQGIGKTKKPFTRCVFVINDKNYSTFDRDLMDGFTIEDHVKVSGKIEDGFFNMVNMEKIGVEEITVPVEKVGSNGKSKYDYGSCYTSYAKDIFCAFKQTGTENKDCKELMAHSIALVKQAK